MRSVVIAWALLAGVSLCGCGGNVSSGSNRDQAGPTVGTGASSSGTSDPGPTQAPAGGAVGVPAPKPSAPTDPTPMRLPTDKGPPATFDGPALRDYASTEISGEMYGTLWGTAIVGDLNDDGFDDWFVIDRGGSPLPASLEQGVRSAAYLFYGRPAYPPAMSVLDADLIIRGADYVAALGDIDGDGFDDAGVAHGCGCDSLGTGIYCGCEQSTGVSILFGGQTHVGEARLDLIGMFAPAPPLSPGSLSLQYSSFIHGAGDLDADGYADFLHGQEGSLRLFYGGPELREQGLDLVKFDADWTAEYCGMGWGPGDIDGDGYDDLLIAGSATRLFYGGPSRLKGNLDAGADATFEIESRGDMAHAAGDQDGDGIADFALPTGRSVVFFYGGPPRFQGTLSLAYRDFSLLLASNNIEGFGIGDVNRDGRPDSILGDPKDETNGFQSGAMFVVPGAAKRRTQDLMVGKDHAALYGDVSIEVTSDLGYCISSGGDVDGDGFQDILVAKPDNHTGDASGGKVILVFGTSFEP